MIVKEGQESSTFLPPILFSSFVEDNNVHYCVRRYLSADDQRQNDYQRLRAEVFVHQKGWNLPLDENGRERDRYDDQFNDTIHIHCVYGVCAKKEYLLAGIRVLQLDTWADSMVTNEFVEAGMIPSHILSLLRSSHCQHLLELTRLCVQRGRWYSPDGGMRFHTLVARDLAYASVYAQATETGRTHALSLVDTHYLRIIRRSHFVFTEIYIHREYALVMIDLWATIDSINKAGDRARAQRMLALSHH